MGQGTQILPYNAAKNLKIKNIFKNIILSFFFQSTPLYLQRLSFKLLIKYLLLKNWNHKENLQKEDIRDISSGSNQTAHAKHLF